MIYHQNLTSLFLFGRALGVTALTATPALAAEPDVRKQFIDYGADLRHVTPDEMARRIRANTTAWAKVIQGSSIRFE